MRYDRRPVKRPSQSGSHAAGPASVGATIERIGRQFHRARLAYGHGTHDAWQEATWLTAHVLKAPFESIAARTAEAIPARNLHRIHQLASRRVVERMPMAYLLNEAWLGDYRFYVDERVIVPRSFIAELLLGALSPWVRRPSAIRRVLDLCTGSGCLAILAAHAFPNAMVDAIDLSPPALQVARRNVRMHAMSARVRVMASDLFDAVRGERYDVILSNPPYVNKAAMARLPREYLHEPRMALAAGSDGLDVTMRIIDEAAVHLTPNGRLIVEIGHNRTVLERKRPRLPFYWITTSAGDDLVFLLHRADLFR